MINLLLIDSQIQSVNQFTDACNENTKFIVYDSFQDTFENINQKINVLNLPNIDNLGFVFVDEHNPFKLFVSYNTFISFNESSQYCMISFSFFSILTLDESKYSSLCS
jgi:phosphopentomutase